VKVWQKAKPETIKSTRFDFDPANSPALRPARLTVDLSRQAIKDREAAI
jgi:hypothetical protein